MYTLRFGPDEAAPAHRGHLQDANYDGIMDLVAHFRTQETGIECGDTEAMVTKNLVDGEVFQGSDSILTVGCGVNRDFGDLWQLSPREPRLRPERPMAFDME